MTTPFTSAELIAAAKAYMAAEAKIMTERPDGWPRAAWRSRNADKLPPTSFQAKCGRVKCRLEFSANNGNPYDLWVWAASKRNKLLRQIDLRAPDADQKLADFERL
jgi:hypothetical protein